MKRLIAITALILLLVAAFIPQAGCNNKETEVTPSESNHWLELLNVIPANDNTLKTAYLNDSAYTREKIEQYPEVMTGYETAYGSPFSASQRYNYSDEEWKQTLGFVSADVDQKIYAGASPPDYYEAVRGRFSREDIDNAVKTGPMNDILEVVSYQGHEFYSWGGDHEINLSRRSNVRPLGKGFRLALVDNFIFWVAWTDGMREMIDSYEDNIDSLADIEDYKLLAEALVELDTIGAFFSSESQSQSHVREVYKDVLEDTSDERPQRLAFVDEIDRQVRLKPYQALATGTGIYENGFYMVIVLLNSNEEVAKENATLLEQRINQAKIAWHYQQDVKWSDLVESMEIQSKGRLTLAKLYGEIFMYWNKFQTSVSESYEPLLMHE